MMEHFVIDLYDTLLRNELGDDSSHHHQSRRHGLAAFSLLDCSRVVFTSLSLQRHFVSRYMKAKTDKFERNERLLRQELVKDPDNARTVFYLANTLRDMQRYADAIPLYERRSRMSNGWWVEQDYALYMLSWYYLGLDDLDNARKYGELAASKSKRSEPLYHLVYYVHHCKQHTVAWYYYTLASGIPKPPTSQALFIAVDIYNFWLDYEKATLSRHVFPGEPMVALEAGHSFLNNVHAPQYLRDLFYREEWSTHVVQPLPTYVALYRYIWAPTGKGNYSWQLFDKRDGKSDRANVHDNDCNLYDHNAKEASEEERPLEDKLPLLNALFETTSEEETWCIVQWYPLQVGKMVADACEFVAHIAAPRSFSFLSKASNGAQYQGDTWFLAWSYSTDPLQDETTPRALFHLVALDARLQITTYTLPFTLPQVDIEKYADATLNISQQGEVTMVLTESTDANMTSVVHYVSLFDLVPLSVIGPKT
jgi:hypothetical protein